MSAKQTEDGGAAFPASPTYGPNGNLFRPADIGCEGMSLRDWFAGQVAPVIWKQYQEDGTAVKFPNWKEGVSVEAYRIADAMLEARKGGAE